MQKRRCQSGRNVHKIILSGGFKEAITNTNNKKQQGPDKIFPEFIKNFGPKAKDTLL